VGRKSKGLQNYTSAQVKALINKDSRLTLGIRILIVYQVSLGKPARELAEFFQISFKQVLNLAERFDNEGIEGLIDRPGRGRKCRLTP
jgi:transposase